MSLDRVPTSPSLVPQRVTGVCVVKPEACTEHIAAEGQSVGVSHVVGFMACESFLMALYNMCQRADLVYVCVYGL